MTGVLSVGSLFSGIGGFDLGLERAGMQTRWFCEQDRFCTKVLNKHWPALPVYPDVTKLEGTNVEPVDVLCGGFPCQDLSLAGKGAGLAGARSGLWSEYARLVGELRPRYVIVENVAALLGRGFGTVLGDLAALGFDAEWTCLRASEFGAPHERDRLWLVAYPASVDGQSRGLLGAGQDRRPSLAARGFSSLIGAPGWRPRGVWGVAKPPSDLLDDGIPRGMGGLNEGAEARSREGVPVVWEDVDAQTFLDGPVGGSRPVPQASVLRQGMSAVGTGGPVHDEQADDVCAVGKAQSRRVLSVRGDGAAARSSHGREHREQRSVESLDFVRGLPQQASRIARLQALGNALVPQIAEWIGRRIVAYENDGIAA